MILTANCPHCSNAVEYYHDQQGDEVLCPNCNSSFSIPKTKRTPPPSMSPEPAAFKVQQFSEETSFLNEKGVMVTNARLVTPEGTYAMSGVTAVKPVRNPPRLLGLISVALLSLLIWPYGILAFLTLIIIAFFRKPTYQVILTTSSGEEIGYESKDKEFVSRIVYALNQAIVHRG